MDIYYKLDGSARDEGSSSYVTVSSRWNVCKKGLMCVVLLAIGVRECHAGECGMYLAGNGIYYHTYAHTYWHTL